MLTIWDKILENARLVTLPDIYFRLKKVLSDPDYTVTDIAEIIAYDPAVSVRLLHMVNSAYFGFNTPVNSIERAVTLLGAKTVSKLVLAVSLTRSFAGMSSDIMDMQQFWRRSVVCAISARELARQADKDNQSLDREHLFLCGLLCDIGHMFIYQAVPDKAQLAIKFAADQNKSLYRVERSLLGVDYANVGAALMRRWQLPQSLWEPTEYHVQPELSQEYQKISCLIHIASHISEPINQHKTIDSSLHQISPLAWQITGLNEQICQEIIPQVEAQIEDIMQMLFPTEQAA